MQGSLRVGADYTNKLDRPSLNPPLADAHQIKTALCDETQAAGQRA